MLLWLCIFASLVFVLLYGLCVLYSGHPRVSVLGGIMGLFFGTVSLAVRPLILGHLFLVTELLILHVARRKNRRWLWALPPLFAAWVNCHGSYLLGLLVLGIVALCSFIRIQTASLVPDTWTSRERALLCGVFLVCIAALFVNPVGPRLVTYPLDVFTGQSDGLANAAEWRALDVQDLRGLALFTMAGVIGLIFLLRRPVLRVDELALLALGFASALRHVRMLFVFAILVGPILCRLLSGARRRVERDRDNQVVYGGLILASIAIMILAFPGTDQLQRQVSSAEPVQAVDFIRRSGISGPMLNEYLWGSYLIWALPEQKVFVDSRSDIFDWTGVLREYVRWSTMQEDPGLLLDKYAIQYCLLPRAAPMSFVMRYLPGWREIYTDEVAVIFARTHR